METHDDQDRNSMDESANSLRSAAELCQLCVT